jgi:N,N'-diacetyllegionaminate synthase
LVTYLKNNIEIIAEAGINHNGNYKKALKLIDIAKAADADYVKFQLFSTENFINKNFSHKKVDYSKIYKRFKSLEFTYQAWKKIINYGKNIKIKVFFSVFDLESLKILKKLKIKLIKIPSGEINNYQLLREINKNNFKIILSTGMSNLKEIKKALNLLKGCNVTLMHCVSEYPTVSPNLNNIPLLIKKFRKKVGYSDHTEDAITPALSIMMGATLIEKHFTFNKDQKIGDHNFSLSSDQLKKMIKNIRLAENSFGLTSRVVSKKEMSLRYFARKGIYFNKEKFKGEKIKKKDLVFLRPEGSLSIDKINKILNKKLSKDIKKLESINFNSIKK